MADKATANANVVRLFIEGAVLTDVAPEVKTRGQAHTAFARRRHRTMGFGVMSQGAQAHRAARIWAAAVLGLVLLLSGCARRRPDATPEGVVREWLDRMQRVHGDPEEAREAYALLSLNAKANLEERARRASAATGRKMEPEQMIAPSRFSTRFVPRQLHARIAGDRAVVEAVGAEPETERALVPVVREEGGWRIDLVLPALPPVERRPDAGVW